jgi:hypothetical protein
MMSSSTYRLQRRLAPDKIESQAGMTPISALLLVALASLGVYLILKIAPVYIESYAVSSSITSLKKDFELKTRSEHELYGLLLKRFQINDIKHISRGNIDKKIKIKRTRDFFHFTVKYDVVVPLFSNVSLLFDIHKEIEV